MSDTESNDTAKLVDLLDDKPIAMMTTFGPEGPRSIPMARQQVDPGAEMWFITARDTEHTRAIEAEPRIALTFSARDSWVAMTGRAKVVHDTAKLEELWNTFAEAWLPEGPDSDRVVLLRVDVEKAEYWDSPGGKIASLLSFAKVKLTGDTYDADHGTVEP